MPLPDTLIAAIIDIDMLLLFFFFYDNLPRRFVAAVIYS